MTTETETLKDAISKADAIKLLDCKQGIWYAKHRKKLKLIFKVGRNIYYDKTAVIAYKEKISKTTANYNIVTL